MGRITEFHQKELAQTVGAPRQLDQSGFNAQRSVVGSTGFLGSLAAGALGRANQQRDFSFAQIGRGLGDASNIVAQEFRVRQQAQARAEAIKEKQDQDIIKGVFSNKINSDLPDILDQATKAPSSKEEAIKNFNEMADNSALETIQNLGVDPTSPMGKELAIDMLRRKSAFQRSVIDKADASLNNKRAEIERGSIKTQVDQFSTYTSVQQFNEGMKLLNPLIGDASPIKTIVTPSEYATKIKPQGTEAAKQFIGGMRLRGDLDKALSVIKSGALDPYIKPTTQLEMIDAINVDRVKQAQGTDAQTQIDSAKFFSTINDVFAANVNISPDQQKQVLTYAYAAAKEKGLATPTNLAKLVQMADKARQITKGQEDEAIQGVLARARAGEPISDTPPPSSNNPLVPPPPPITGAPLGPGVIPPAIQGRKANTPSGFAPPPPTGVPPSGAVNDMTPISEAPPANSHAVVSKVSVVKEQQAKDELAKVNAQQQVISAQMQKAGLRESDKTKLFNELASLQDKEIAARNKLQVITATREDEDAKFIPELRAKYRINLEAAKKAYGASPEAKQLAEQRTGSLIREVTSFTTAFKRDVEKGAIKPEELINKVENLYRLYDKSSYIEAEVNVDGFGLQKTIVPGFGEQHNKVRDAVNKALTEVNSAVTSYIQKTFASDFKMFGANITGAQEAFAINATTFLSDSIKGHPVLRGTIGKMLPSNEAVFVADLRGDVERAIDVEQKRLNRDLTEGEVGGLISEAVYRRVFIDLNLGAGNKRPVGQVFGLSQGDKRRPK